MNTTNAQYAYKTLAVIILAVENGEMNHNEAVQALTVMQKAIPSDYAKGILDNGIVIIYKMLAIEVERTNTIWDDGETLCESGFDQDRALRNNFDQQDRYLRQF